MGLLSRNKFKKIDNVQAIPESQAIQQQEKELQAVIIAAEVGADGEYFYKVVTNYPLNLGGCSLMN